ncbi:MAG TPA: PIG-L family deacetylase, partial [Ferruginibacter sp.]|nr:PIG-L family deacetylase [Ferruginibacter sp.]
MKQIIAAIISIFIITGVRAQSPKTYSSADILQQLKKLEVFGSVLYIAAHPDDENTRLLAYLANERRFRTGYMSLTRGDGGQNLIGDEQGIDLGLIRTQELLAARRIDGAEQFFSTAYDFCYSKSPEETLQKWGHDKILSDVVWVIRNFKPDVIITRFPTTGEGGHGHHTASAILAGEAFDAAADASKFPEQLKNGVTVWQAKRLLWNTFNFGGTNTQREDQLKIDVGLYNPILGKSYGEMAAESRSQHKSQGFGVPAQRGESFEYFSLIKGERPVSDLMDGIDLNGKEAWMSLVKTRVAEMIHDADISNTSSITGMLAKFYKDLQQLPTGYWRDQK